MKVFLVLEDRDPEGHMAYAALKCFRDLTDNAKIFVAKEGQVPFETLFGLDLSVVIQEFVHNDALHKKG